MDIIFRFRPAWERSTSGTVRFRGGGGGGGVGGVTVNSSIVCYHWVKHCLQDHGMKT